MRFLKNTLNFTRTCALAQKAKFYVLKMLKKQILTHPKAAKLATLVVNTCCEQLTDYIEKHDYLYELQLDKHCCSYLLIELGITRLHDKLDGLIRLTVSLP